MKSDLVAIIGVSCLLPEASNIFEYWNNLLLNRNCLKTIPKERFFTHQYKAQLMSNICTQGGFIPDIACFDRQFFGISPNEAKQMDPQQRLALQEAWHCIEDANIDIKVLQKYTTGVFAAQMNNDYLQLLIDDAAPVDQYTCIGNYASSLANRISHHLKLSGPSITTNTACAGSLVAIHQARQSLLTEECDYALVIAANLICHPLKHLSFSMAGMLSRSGKCHTFEAHADGYVPGEGICAVLLCREHLAKKLNHHVYANILQSAMNHNAGTNNISSPSIDKQAALIQSLYPNASLNHLDYIELHGTGTSLGDPIEYQALQKALGDKLKRVCLLGSVKTNIGHLEASAGLAGLIKVVLMLEHETIVPSFQMQTPNPLINLKEQLFQLSTSQKTWHSNPNAPRIAGISSMGFGGVNAHIVISDHTKKYLPAQTKQHSLIPFLISLKTEDIIEETKKHWLSLITSTNVDISKICLASIHNRSNLDFRFAYLTKNPSKIGLLQALTTGRFIKKQELPYLIFDTIDFEIPAVQQTNISDIAQSKIQAIENTEFKVSNKQKTDMITQIYLLDVLTQANIKFRTIICSEKTMFGVLFYLDCISLKNVEDHINTGIDLQIDYEKLQIPLMVGNTPIIDVKYLNELFSLQQFNHRELKKFLSQSLLLSKHQYTFKGLLKRWQNHLHKYHIDLFEQWQSLLNTNDSDINQTQFIIIIAILICLEKLKKTWGLTYCINDNILNNKLQDLAYFIANNILDEDDVIRGVLSDAHFNVTSLLQKINLKLVTLDGLPFLRSKHLSIPYKCQSENMSFFETYSENNVIYIGKNCSNIPMSRWSLITAGNLDEKIISTIVNQWLHGQDIHWTSFFPNHQDLRLVLPKYQFNSKETFWPDGTAL